MMFLAGDYQIGDIHRFKERLPNVKKCTKCHQELVKSEDGDKAKDGRARGYFDLVEP